MQWDLGKIWGDGWVFYFITIVIFGLGLGCEVSALYKTKRKFQGLAKNLKILEDNKNKGISFKGLEKWFKENLLAEKVDPIDSKFRLQLFAIHSAYSDCNRSTRDFLGDVCGVDGGRN
jgi:hypothetical protein